MLSDAALTSKSNNIRQLFAIILTSYSSQAHTLREKYGYCMIKVILHRIRQTDQCQNIVYTLGMCNEALLLIEYLFVSISNLPLNYYGMPSPDRPASRSQ